MLTEQGTGANERDSLVRTHGHSEQTGYGGASRQTPASHSASDFNKSSETSTAKSTTSSQRISMPSISASAKPIGQFRFLDRSYKVNVPTCPLPQANELFKSVCERYDLAVVNREKIDEALTDFKKVLGMDLNATLEECLEAWKDYLTKPRFTITCKEGTGDVKNIRVRADNIPVVRRKAQKHMQDLLDASHLFLQQREFLQQHIVNDLSQLEQLSANLKTLATDAKLSSSEKKQLPRIVSSARQQFADFPDVLEMFWRQTYSLVQDINTAVHVLDGVSEPGSLGLL